MLTKPWAEGPIELMKHGLEHLQLGNDFDTRIAMISIDNAVELMIKTYLGLPVRITGIQGLSRKRYDELIQNFPSLLDGLQEFASDKLIGIGLGDVEWFHRLRNQLYHEGNGITVEKGKVEGYAEIAKILLSNLFSVSVEDFLEKTPHNLVGEFISKWACMEINLVKLCTIHFGPTKRYEAPMIMVEKLTKTGILNRSYIQDFNKLRIFRNNVAHGFATPSAKDLRTHITILNEMLQSIEPLLKQKKDIP